MVGYWLGLVLWLWLWSLVFWFGALYWLLGCGFWLVGCFMLVVCGWILVGFGVIGCGCDRWYFGFCCGELWVAVFTCLLMVAFV